GRRRALTAPLLGAQRARQPLVLLLRLRLRRGRCGLRRCSRLLGRSRLRVSDQVAAGDLVAAVDFRLVSRRHLRLGYRLFGSFRFRVSDQVAVGDLVAAVALGSSLCLSLSCLVVLLFVSHLYLSVLAAVACRSVC